MASKSTQSALEIFKQLPPVLARFFKTYPPVPIKQYASKPTLTTAPDRNPFLIAYHPVTKKAHEPKISLRRQSDLYKLAKLFGLEKTLPPMTKKFGIQKMVSKKSMKGVVRPKLHKHERTAEERREKREKAIAEADELIIKVKGKRYAKKVAKRALPPKNLF
ncbi:hypothetical protein V1504DRAFT_455969 [Lipomyces starkeyi]